MSAVTLVESNVMLTCLLISSVLLHVNCNEEAVEPYVTGVYQTGDDVYVRR